jgi:hypothetical protein
MVRPVGCMRGLGVRPGSIRGGPAATAAATRGHREPQAAEARPRRCPVGGLGGCATLEEPRPAGLDGRCVVRSHP